MLLNGNQIGIDLGLKEFVITSNGEKYDNPKYFKQAQKKLKRLQRSLSRKVKGSSNRVKARNKVSLAHEKVANKRLDMHHKLSFKLTCENQVIGLEDLNIKGMVKNHKLGHCYI